MKTFIYYGMPGYGHINPTLNVARELVKKGNKVIFYATEEFKDYIEDAGVIYKNYDYHEPVEGAITRNMGVFIKKLAEMARHKLPEFIKVAKEEKVDCVMHDSLAVWGKIVAQHLHVPAVCFITSAAFNKRTFLAFPQMYPNIVKATLNGGHMLAAAYGQYSLLAARYGARLGGPGETMICKEKLNIVFSVKSFQPQVKSFAKTFHFVGPSIHPRLVKDNLLKSFPENQKIIYISYGTLINDKLDFYSTCIKAFKNTKYTVIMSLGSKFDPEQLGSVPENFIIKKYVDQLTVLQKADLFISHAGMNSVTESLYYGVPMVLVPDTDEQLFNALSVEKIGAGLLLEKKDLTAQSLFEAAKQVLESPYFEKKAQSVSKEFIESGGYKEAANQVLHYIS